MADRDRGYGDGNEPLDPELLYTKDVCIGGGSFGKVYKGQVFLMFGIIVCVCVLLSITLTCV